jgi:serine/threonine protein kinase
MGRVWRATDVVLHREVAIKELVPPPGLTPDERREMRERSLREARAIARLNNINVVRVFDVLRTDADPWIVMEYVPSRSLQDALASDGPFPPVRAAEIGLGVLNALRAAHRNGVVHRDVKPGNVLIGADGRVVLTDFGLATVPGDPNVTRTGLVLGSPAYIAPERARDGTAGPGADLWSLGATLYAAVEGSSPFARPTAIATLAALATENPPQSRNAGPLKPVLNGLLRKDPTHRINAEETERLLLRATGKRSKLTFPMSPTMRRPGVGRERPALPGSTPVVPGGPAAAGSAPVVPGPRPPVTSGRSSAPGRPTSPGAPPVTPGRPAVAPAASAEGRAPVYVPGKASVGRAQRPGDTPTRVDGPKIDKTPIDATRIDAPPAQSRPQQNQDLLGTSGDAPQTAADPQSGATPGAPVQHPSALGKGSRGAYGTITPGGAAGPRDQPVDAAAAQGSLAERAVAERAAAQQATANRVAAEQETADRATRERSAADRVAAEQAAAERAATEKAAADRAATQKATAELEAFEKAAAAWEAAEQARADRAAAERATARRLADERAAAQRAAAQQAAEERAAADRAAAERAERERIEAAEMAAAEQAAAERAAAEKAAAERAEQEKAAAQRKAAAKAAAEQAAAKRAERERIEAERAAAELAAAERAAVERAADERAAEERASAAEAEALEAHEAEAGQVEAIEVGQASAVDSDVADGSTGDKADAGPTRDKATDPETESTTAPTESDSAARAAEDMNGSPAAEPTPDVADADGPLADEEPSADEGAGSAVDSARSALKPAPGARAGAHSSKSSRKKGRGRTPARNTRTGTTAIEAPDAEHSVESTPLSSTAAPAEPKTADADRADPAPEADQNTSESTTSAATVETVAEPVDTEAASPDDNGPGKLTVVPPSPAEDVEPSEGQPAKDTGTRTSKVAALRSRERKVTTATLPATEDGTAEAGVIGFPLARTKPAKPETPAVEPDQADDRTTLVGEPIRKDRTTADATRVVGPNRPAWQPMQVMPRPPAKGLTVFGMTLTRRQTTIGGAILLALILLLVFLVPKAFGDDKPGDNNRKTGAAPITSAGVKPTSDASAGAGPATSPQQASTAPSSAPASGAAVPLPDGWYLYNDKATGFSVPVPKDWAVSHQGSEVYFRERGGQYRLLIVDQTNTPAADPVKDWSSKESQRRGEYRNYHQIGIRKVSYWDNAADWEYTYNSNRGNPLHVVKRGFITAKDQAYGITWSTSEKDWAANKPNLDLIYKGFIPAKS